MVVLRLVHLFSAMLWVGATFTVVLFISETARALGPDAQKFMSHFTLRSRFQPVIASVSGLTVLSGLLMYYHLFGWLAPLNTGPGLALTIGALAGLAAMGVGIRMSITTNQMRRLANEMQAKGGKPKPEQLGLMAQLQEKMGKLGATNAVLMTIALAGMTLSEYFAF